MAGRRKSRRVSRLRRWLGRLLYVAVGFAVVSVALVLPLRWFDPVITAFMLQENSGLRTSDWTNWPDIALAAKLAVVAAEDQRFVDHFGLDLAAIQKAVNEQDQRGYLRGASTISQQTAKNLYLWPGRSLVRKGLEAWLTVLLELCLPKQRILEIYLNVAEFGPGVYGVTEASRHFFGKGPGRINNAEAALLVAVLPNPKQLRVNNPSPYVRERQRWILSQMARLDRERWITRIER